MKTRLIPVVALVLASAAGVAAANRYDWRFPAWLSGTEKPSPASPQAATDKATQSETGASARDEAIADTRTALAPRTPEEQEASAPRLDISRISKDGTSVFAGTAKPHAAVTVLADGKPVATAIADANGEWSVATDTKIENAESKITLAEGQATAAAIAPSSAKPAAPAPVEPPAAAATTAEKPAAASASPAGEAIEKLEALVADARKEAETGASSKASPSPTAVDPLAVEKPAAEPGKTEVSIPVPIMFVYNEATLTPEGEWAAKLLVEYVKLKHLDRLSLTGHADERGSDAYNMELSKERLDRVAAILREGGYDGKLDLIPKGKSEPYQGIDRARFSADALYQMDRRVELKFTRTQ